MSRHDKVAVYFDWENLSWSDLVVDQQLSPEVIVSAVRKYASRFGTVTEAHAYANFEQSGLAGLQSKLQTLLVEPRHTSAKTISGEIRKNVSDIEISLDIYDELIKRGGSDVFVLVSGDRDMFPIVRRLLAKNKAVYIVAAADCFSREMQDMATGTATLEELLGIPRRDTVSRDSLNGASEGVVPVVKAPKSALSVLEPPSPPVAEDALVKLLQMEGSGMPFVGFKLLQRSISSDELYLGAARDAINQCVEDGSIESYKVTNPHSEFMTAAVRAVRDHPDVQAIMGAIEPESLTDRARRSESHVS